MPKTHGKEVNYLDLVPKFKDTIKCQSDEDDKFIIEVKNTGAFNKIAQVVFKKPKNTNVHLDDFGSFVCNQIDGEKTVCEIADLVKSKFGEDAEPLYPRLVKFMQILGSYNFIELVQKS